jgi:predicted CoA-binding protein
VKKTIVIGASPNPDRYSYKAVQALLKAGIECIPIGLKQGQIEGLSIQQTADNCSNIDTISLYIGAQNQHFWRELILKMNPSRVIFNPGTENTAFESELKQHDIQVELACTLVLIATGQF